MKTQTDIYSGLHIEVYCDPVTHQQSEGVGVVRRRAK